MKHKTGTTERDSSVHFTFCVFPGAYRMSRSGFSPTWVLVLPSSCPTLIPRMVLVNPHPQQFNAKLSQTNPDPQRGCLCLSSERKLYRHNSDIFIYYCLIHTV